MTNWSFLTIRDMLIGKKALIERELQSLTTLAAKRKLTWAEIQSFKSHVAEHIYVQNALEEFITLTEVKKKRR